MSWIPVSKKLPDADIIVLVAFDDGEVWPAYLGDEQQWYYITADLIDGPSKITHWMDLPEPPAKEAA